MARPTRSMGVAVLNAWARIVNNASAISPNAKRAATAGIGNIVGFGEEIVIHFTNRGVEYAY